MIRSGPYPQPFAWLAGLAMALMALMALSLVAACAPGDTNDSSPDTEAVSEAPATAVVLRQALDHPDRPEADRDDDANRKPDEVLAFFGIEPGMRVLDLLAGGGYYTEILSRVVGPSGKVYFHNNQGYTDFLGEALDNRTAEGRLANVSAIRSELDQLELPPASLDAVILVLGYHDTYWQPDDGSWPSVDRPRLLAELRSALVPGGVLGIVDHAAQPGGDTTAVVNDLHRIDEAVVRADLAAAGFTLAEVSDLLRNPDDARDVQVFDESIRRRTDRFVLRFRR